MKFTTVSKGLQTALLREASVMSKMANASVVRLYDSFQDDIFLYLVMEYSPLGDLEGYIEKKQGKFELAEVSLIIRELSNGLRFLRTQSIVHRDLKPANILLFHKSAVSQESKEFPARIADLACKLTDFTMARRLDDGELAKTVCGSPLYMAPEVLNRRNYTDKADLWSVGVILFRLIFNTMPFNGLNEMDLRDNLNHKPVPIPQGDPRLTPELLDLLTGLLQKDPFLRIDWEEFFMHPFLRPPRLGSTIMTDESLDATASPFGLDSLTSDLTSVSAQGTIELRTQIRDYENRLQSAQKQVKLLLGELEQSQLRELLKDQQLQRQIVSLPPPVAAPSSGSAEPAPSATSPSGSASGNAKVNPHKGTIKFSEPAVEPSSPASTSPPESFTSSAYGTSSSGATPGDPSEAATTFVQQKLQRLGASHLDPTTQSQSDSNLTSRGYGITSGSSNGSSTSMEGAKLRPVAPAPGPAPIGGQKPPSSDGPAAAKGNHSENGDVASSPEAIAAQSSIQLLLSQIHPDRALAIDIVQQLLAEVLVSPNELLESISLASSTGKPASETFPKTPDAKNSAPLSTASRSAPASSPFSEPASSSASSPLKKGPSARNGISSQAPPAISVASSSAPPFEDTRMRRDVHSPPIGATPEQLVAWEDERRSLAAESDQWRQLFSQLTNDYDNVTAQLSDAKTMVTVLQDDLKDRDDKLATHARLEQEYTRSAIYLEDQLRGSRERVSYLEAEFKALDDYRKQVQQQQRRN